MSRVLLLTTLLGFVIGAADQATAGKRRGAMIVSPKRDAKVTRSAEVIGKLHTRGQPVVLIRPAEGDGTWWIQPVPKPGERGHFRADVRFGGASAKHGDKFLIAVLILRTPQDYAFIRDKEALEGLPGNILQSEQVPVILEDDVSLDPVQAEITSTVLKPQADEKVSRVVEMIGRVDEGKQPAVLVRAAGIGGLWWVQDAVQMGKGGYFKTTARFGNAKTPSGTKFQMVVVTPRSEREAEPLKPGNSFASLPLGIPRSKVIAVELHRPSGE